MEPFALCSGRQSCGGAGGRNSMDSHLEPKWKLVLQCFTGSMETHTPLSFILDCKLS